MVKYISKIIVQSCGSLPDFNYLTVYSEKESFIMVIIDTNNNAKTGIK